MVSYSLQVNKMTVISVSGQVSHTIMAKGPVTYRPTHIRV